MSLRKRIADSRWFNATVEGLLAAYVRFSYRSSSWERTGFKEMDDLVARGEPIIMVLWHQRLIMAPFLFDTSLGKIMSLTSSGRAGRLAGNMLTRFGYDTVPMSSHNRHVATSRRILGRIREGCSIGIAADGPRGPARELSTVPLIWARSSGCPVFLVSFSANRVLELPTWDRMWLPTPLSRGVLTCQRWQSSVPRNLSDSETEELRRRLELTLDDTTDASDTATGRMLPR